MQIEKLLNKENVEYAIFYKLPNENKLRFCDYEHTGYNYNIEGTVFYAVQVNVVIYTTKDGIISKQVEWNKDSKKIKLYTIIIPRKKKRPHNGEENI